MKKRFLFIGVFLLLTLCASSQKLTVVDGDGSGIHLVTVLDEEGNMIGSTDLSGTILDVKGARTVVLSHVAFKPKTVDVGSVKDGKVVLEDADFSLAEIYD